MAVANYWSSRATVKAVLLPFTLVLLAVAAGASIAEDGPAVAKSGGRFSQTTPVGRRLLQSVRACGSGLAPNYNCTAILGPAAFNATCCTDNHGNQGCWDVGAFWVDKCGSCNTKCVAGEVCCSGVCVDLITDQNNCGICGNKCHSTTSCQSSMCGY